MVKDSWTALEDRFAKIIEGAVEAIKDKTVRNEIRDAIEAGDVQGALDAIRWDAGDAKLRAEIPQGLRTALELGGAQAAAALSTSFDIVNPEAVAFVREHGAEFISEFGQTSQEAIRELIRRTVAAEERSITGRRLASPGRLARQIADSGIGLTDRQLNSLERFRLDLEERTTLTDLQIDARVARKAQQLLRTRSRLIARTEVMRAAREGNQALWRQALERGLLTRQAVQIWHTEPGACDECDPLDETTAPIGEDFEDPGGEGPPLHPACRCTLTVRA